MEKEKHKSPFTFPCVSVEEAEAFDIDRQETWTKSILVNATMEAFEHVNPLSRRTLAAYLGLNPYDLSHGFKAVMGIDLLAFTAEWRKLRFRRLLREQPSITGKEMTVRLGFASQGALWTFLTKNHLIEPLTKHWYWGDYLRLNKQVTKEHQQNVKAEIQRRKWKEMTKNSK